MKNKIIGIKKIKLTLRIIGHLLGLFDVSFILECLSRVLQEGRSVVPNLRVVAQTKQGLLVGVNH